LVLFKLFTNDGQPGIAGDLKLNGRPIFFHCSVGLPKGPEGDLICLGYQRFSDFFDFKIKKTLKLTLSLKMLVISTLKFNLLKN